MDQLLKGKKRLVAPRTVKGAPMVFEKLRWNAPLLSTFNPLRVGGETTRLPLLEANVVSEA